MQSESNIEYDINKLNNNSSLKNISREQKKINGERLMCIKAVLQ